tara:strand:+ start:656 stop:1885 length:1230 start_codon:yes stop_codon:yes gene_type:complete
MPKEVLIVGAGIGGLALAIACQRQNIRATVLERADALSIVGAGIQLSPNATRVLGYLGVWDTLVKDVVFPGKHRFVAWDTAEPLLVTPLGDTVAAAFGTPYAHAHRADLLRALQDALDERTRLVLDADVVSVGQAAERAFAVTRSGERYEADALIGADGVRSFIREQLFTPQPPKHSGCMAWRGLTPAADVADLGFAKDSYIWMGPRRSVVVYYVSGGTLLNWIGMGPSDGQTRESWTTQGTVTEALDEFAEWHPMIRGLIERSAPPYKWALYDREPLADWVSGNIALMGDAAHAMLPYHAQGAGQSIEDAWVLARALALHQDTGAALNLYSTLRQPRTRQVQEASRAAEHLFHLHEPDEVARRNKRFSVAQTRIGDGFPPGQEWLFAYDAEAAATGADDEWRKLNWRA